MKKMFKLFMCAAIVAAGFTACSEEVTPIDDPTNPITGPVDPAEQGEETTATFAFRFDGATPVTRAMDAAIAEPSPAVVANFRVLLFNAGTGFKELDTIKKVSTGDTLMTAVVRSGAKHLYVIVNDSLDNNTKSLIGLPDRNAIASDTYFNTYEFTVGSNVSTPDLTGLRKLYTLTPTTGRYVYSSAIKPSEYQIDLKGKVTPSESQDPTNDNYVRVTLERAMAKVAITQTASASTPSGITPNLPNGVGIVTKDSSGGIFTSDVKYLIWGANVATYPFQRWNGNTLVTPEYIPTDSVDANTPLHYVQQLGGSGNAPIAIAVRPGNGPAVGDYYYIPENNPSAKKKGNITIAAVEATFLPLRKYYVTNVTYNAMSKEFTADTPAVHSGTAGQDFYLLKVDAMGLPKLTVVAGTNAANVAKKIIYHMVNRDSLQRPLLTNYATLVHDSCIGNVTPLTKAHPTDTFSLYKDGKCYYRLKIGEQAAPNSPIDASVDAIVMRNYSYDANITGFAKLGENTPNKLIEPNNADEDAETNLSVNITIRPWTSKIINGDL
jgi:hypothetical protein